MKDTLGKKYKGKNSKKNKILRRIAKIGWGKQEAGKKLKKRWVQVGLIAGKMSGKELVHKNDQGCSKGDTSGGRSEEKDKNRIRLSKFGENFKFQLIVYHWWIFARIYFKDGRLRDRVTTDDITDNFCHDFDVQLLDVLVRRQSQNT